jgi:hypothetical protein
MYYTFKWKKDGNSGTYSCDAPDVDTAKRKAVQYLRSQGIWVSEEDLKVQ